MRIVDFRPKNIAVWLLSAFAIIVPLEYYIDPSFGISAMRISQAQIFQVGAILFFAIFMLRNLWMGLFLVWSLFLYAYYSFPSPSGIYVTSILSACLLYEVSYRLITKENVGLIFKCLIYFAIFNVAYMAMQLNGWELMFKEFTRPGFQSSPVGFFGLKAIMGMFLALVIPIVCMQSPIAAGLLFIPIATSESSCAVVGAVVSYLWVLWHKSRKWFFILVTFLAIGGTLYTIHDSKARMMTDRFNMWKTVLRDTVKKPITGYGLDSFRSIGNTKQFIYWKNVRTLETDAIDIKDIIEWDRTGKLDPKRYPNFKEGDILDPWDNPHNEFLMLFYEFGIVGIILFGFMTHDIITRFNGFDDNLVVLTGFFICLMLISIGQFPFHLARIGIFIPIMLGAYYKLTERKIEVLNV